MTRGGTIQVFAEVAVDEHGNASINVDLRGLDAEFVIDVDDISDDDLVAVEEACARLSAVVIRLTATVPADA